METSVGFASDLRLCTRTSMPSQLLQDCTATIPTPAAKQQLQQLVKNAMTLAAQQRDAEQYRQIVQQLAQIIMLHVRPNRPEDVRLLFDLEEPSEPFASRARMTAAEHYAWLDAALLRSACEKTVDVARDSREPKAAEGANLTSFQSRQ